MQRSFKIQNFQQCLMANKHPSLNEKCIFRISQNSKNGRPENASYQTNYYSCNYIQIFSSEQSEMLLSPFNITNATILILYR